jgi:hypothetical protein
MEPQELGIPECPPAGQGCHTWLYGATHRLVAAGYEDDFIESWLEQHMNRAPQPQEIANTLCKVRAEAGGEIPPTPVVSKKRDVDTERLEDLTRDGPLSVAKFSMTSPDPVEGVSTCEFLTALFGGGKTILFNDDNSQGQIIWSAKTPEHAVEYLAASNKTGLKFLLNPVDGVNKENPRLGKKSRRAEENLTSYDYALLESDSVEPELWLRVLSSLQIPLVAVTLSGNKSAHAIVRVGATSREDWESKASELADLAVPLGADPAALTAVRLTRLPGVVRKDTGLEQKLIWLDRSAAATPVSVSTNGDIEEKSTDDDIPEVKPAAQFDDIYYDGNSVFMRGGDSIWRRENAGMFTSAMKVRGFSDKVPKGAAMSPLDRAKAFIRQNRRVDGAAPCLYHPHDLWEAGGKALVNTASSKVWPANDTAGGWGEGFPRYAAILDTVFTCPEYKTTFLAWFKRFYQSACDGKLEPGQALVLVGPVECFKSFIIERLLQPAMGGYADLSSIASGEGGGFNSELFHSPLAVIDDTRASSSQAQQQKYASIIKKLTAHGTHKYHEKYLVPVMVHWRGRVVIAANDDPVSIRAVPALEISNEDKIIALAMRSWPDNPGPDTWKGIEQDELGAFLAWLKSWEPPTKFLDTNSRYLVRSVVAEEIRVRVGAASPAAELLDTIRLWWKLRTPDEQARPWEGTAVELHQEFCRTLDNVGLVREWPVRALAQRLAQLAARGEETGISVAQRRAKATKVIVWRIAPPEALTEEEEPNPF